MKTFAELFNEIKDTNEYHCEKAKSNFSKQIEDLLETLGISRAELATKLGKTRSYVTKFMRGDTNFTLESMVAISRVLGGTLRVQIEHPCLSAERFEARSAHIVFRIHEDFYQTIEENTPFCISLIGNDSKSENHVYH